MQRIFQQMQKYHFDKKFKKSNLKPTFCITIYKMTR